MTDHDALVFTGERFTPECNREIWFEHWHRYVFARCFVSGKAVLDVACGEGYGSALLATKANHVLGVDIDADAVAHATQRYGKHNEQLTYQVGDAIKLDGLADHSVDVITSFETLEHLAEHDALMGAFKRVLKPNGLLLISTPDKAQYSDAKGFDNEYHVRELYVPQFESLIHRYFSHQRLWGQKLMFGSMLYDMNDRAEQIHAHTAVSGGMAPQQGMHLPPMYVLAACTDAPEAWGTPHDVDWFTDADESVYKHYEQEIRRVIAGGHRIIELEQQVAELQAKLASLNQP